MPIYEYKCPVCDRHIDVMLDSAPESYDEQCTVCSEPLVRVFSPFGIVFKGTGFYRTDSQ